MINASALSSSDTVLIDGLFVGQPQKRWPGKPVSAICKTAVEGSQFLTLTGFEADQQGDLIVHGGPEKAVHHYATDHYGDWQAEGLIPPGTRPAAFGENISTNGLRETNVCIGDIFRLGTALVQISQGRQPCWKLNLHTHQDQMAHLFQKTLRTGWYYRVLEPGSVSLGDTIQLVERPQPNWAVASVTHARLNRHSAQPHARELAQMVELAPGWRKAFAKIAEGNLEEDTTERLG